MIQEMVNIQLTKSELARIKKCVLKVLARRVYMSPKDPEIGEIRELYKNLEKIKIDDR